MHGTIRADLHRSARPIFRLQLAQRWQARHPPRYRGISPYSDPQL